MALKFSKQVQYQLLSKYFFFLLFILTSKKAIFLKKKKSLEKFRDSLNALSS